MSKEMKYVIVNSSAILFSQVLSHADFRHLNPSSAGFCRIYYENNNFTVSCYGESVSLKLKSDQKDEFKIKFILNEY